MPDQAGSLIENVISNVTNPSSSNLSIKTTSLYIVSTVIVISLVSSAVTLIKNKIRSNQFAKIAKKKRTERDQQIKKISLPSVNISSSLKEKVLNSDATALLEMLKAQEVTSEQILITYFQRAITIGLDLELITELNFDEALVRARECDKLRKKNPSACRGILFGLPMSVKDAFVLKGTDCSGGMAAKLYNLAQEDGLLVKILKEEGAIPYIKSNIPQVMMTADSNNFIWGQARNPWSKMRSTGGSSGGEAALIAARCAPLGLGNDIGGSIRIPPIFCGVVGFKPTAERVTTAGTMKNTPTLDNILNMRVATGPIVKTARDANLLMKVLLNSEAHQKSKLSERDPYYTRQEWKDDLVQKDKKGLRIGYYKSVEFFPTSPANQRGVEEAAQALRKRGHEVFELDFPNIEDVIMMYLEVMSAEGGARMLTDPVKGETSIEDYDKLRLAASIPNVLRSPLKSLLGVLGEGRTGLLVDNARKKDSYQYSHLIERHNEVRKAFFKVWEEKKLDALLSPGYAYPANKIGTTKDVVLGACYAFIFNTLNMPTGTLPVTVVKEGEEVYPRENTKYHDFIYKKTVESMEGSAGLPIGVQISTLPWQEEKCIGVMLQLEEEVQFVKKHPYPI